MQTPLRYFNSSPDVIRLMEMMYVRYPLSLRQVEDLLHERGIDICYEGAVKLRNCSRMNIGVQFVQSARVASCHLVMAALRNCRNVLREIR